MEWRETDPSAVIRPQCLAKYESIRDAIWNQLVWLNSSLFVLRKVTAFRFDLFLGMKQADFWFLVVKNFSAAAILAVTRLATDKRSDCLTIGAFRDFTRQALRPEFARELDGVLTQHCFEEHLKQVLGNIKRHRDKWLAHLDSKEALQGGITANYGVSLSDIENVFADLKALFDLLCFGHGHGTLPAEYDEAAYLPGVTGRPTDIEELLDEIARESPLLKAPEQRPDYWESRRAGMPQADIDEVNRRRTKLGLPPA